MPWLPFERLGPLPGEDGRIEIEPVFSEFRRFTSWEIKSGEMPVEGALDMPNGIEAVKNAKRKTARLVMGGHGKRHVVVNYCLGRSVSGSTGVSL